MELSKKVKVALDETRMRILGAQILLGFQFRGVFGDGYDQLPPGSRYLSGVALGLMICVVGLLITPGRGCLARRVKLHPPGGAVMGGRHGGG